MFFADRPLPPPPAPPKPRNESLAASLSSYRTRPTPSSKGSSGMDFTTARALFDVAKQPEVQRGVISAAKNPAVRSTAISLAKNEQLRSAAIKTAQDENARNTVVKIAKIYDAQPAENASHSYGYGRSLTTTSDNHQLTSTPSQMHIMASVPKPTRLYPSLFDERPSSTDGTWVSPQPSLATSSNNTAVNRSSLASGNLSSVQNELASLNLFQSTDKKIPPARPPPPKRRSSTAPASPTNEPHALVKYPYKATQFDELTCQPNDVVLLKKEVDEQWIYALNTRTGEHGIVPIVFLDIKVPLVPTQTSNTMSGAASSIERSETTARALYDYDTGITGDLKFRVNDIIKSVEKVNDDWLRGEIGSSRGIFPANFVHLLTPLPSSQSQQKISSPISPNCLLPNSSGISALKETVVAAYDYNSGVADDLIFRQGDIIEVVERVGAEWIKGRLNGAVGLVPCTYIVESKAPASAATGTKGCCRIVRATTDYFNTSTDHLCFSKGDEIEVVQEVDDQWLKGKLLLNMSNMKSFPTGIFPRSAVQ
uniref:SH3 domain-containing protein n=1 Tax=Parascaris univalens TaxID=6257 RepID=A0A915AVK1_PARUN